MAIDRLIEKRDVEYALGFRPYNDANPDGFATLAEIAALFRPATATELGQVKPGVGMTVGPDGALTPSGYALTVTVQSLLDVEAQARIAGDDAVGQSIEDAQATATAAQIAATAPRTYNDLPGQVRTLPVPLFHPGPTTADEVVLLVVFNQATTVPANLVGTRGLAMTAATAATELVLSTYQAGTWTVRGNLTFQSNGTLTLPALSLINLASGDALRLTGPPVPDATLADFSINLMLVKV